mmetsp:Transcript_111515/g.204578  ORF Transcript_111515/g.204578 Transcript_111515/m.204578 type:complete len:107 (+) Transcript_111515:1-321(+)
MAPEELHQRPSSYPDQTGYHIPHAVDDKENWIRDLYQILRNTRLHQTIGVKPEVQNFMIEVTGNAVRKGQSWAASASTLSDACAVPYDCWITCCVWLKWARCGVTN